MPQYHRAVRQRVRLTRRAALLGSAMSLMSCGGEVSGIDPGPPVPVVEILLVAGQPTQTALIQYSAPAEPIVLPDEVPVDPDSVALELVGPDGSRTPFQPTAGSPTMFQAGLLVAAGETYTLSGMVAGVNVTATATVPETLEVRKPTQDTLFFSRSFDDPFANASVEFSWFAAGANSYVVRQSDREGNTTSLLATTDTAGTFPPFSFYSQADTTRVAIWAYDPSAAAFFLTHGSVPRSSSTAAVVGFGAAVRWPADKIVVWQP
jgi:hypothetical protein